MFDLFHKNQNQNEQLDKCLAKKDWDRLARTYYDMGVAAMDKKDFNSALLWLSRADTIYSASNEVYEKTSKNRLFHKEIVSDCSRRIGLLENAPLLYNEVPAKIEEMAEELQDIHIRIWGLLSMARLVRLGERLGKLPGCEVFGRLGWVVDTILQSFHTPITKDQYDQLMDICNQFYDFGDSEAFYAGAEIGVPCGPAFQVFDLNGMMGVHQEINLYLDNHLQLLSALCQNQEPPQAECTMIGCTLLPDYYVRTSENSLIDTPQIKSELKRIWNDYEFICSGVTWEQIADQMKEYKTLDILQPL
ncbi:hypothetical protein VSQ48_14450 [Candidatus Ventrimonas sp. KK005]